MVAARYLGLRDALVHLATPEHAERETHEKVTFHDKPMLRGNTSRADSASAIQNSGSATVSPGNTAARRRCGGNSAAAQSTTTTTGPTSFTQCSGDEVGNLCGIAHHHVAATTA